MNITYKLTAFLFFLIIAQNFAYSQISTEGMPIAFEDKTLSLHTYEVIEFSTPDLIRINREDSTNLAQQLNYRVGINVPVSISSQTHGTWHKLGANNYVWRLGVKIEKAKGLGLYFSENVSIPKGGKLFIYNKKQSHFVGAFTSQTPKFKATEIIQGEEIVLEFHHYKKELPIINIEEVVFYYRGFKNRFSETLKMNQYKDNGSCEVNIACEEGAPWQNQKDATVVYTFKEGGSTYVCSATIVNNSQQDCKPYILSANHCGYPVASSDVIQNVWYFNYERPACDVGSTTPYNGNLSHTMVGGTLKASSTLGVYNTSNSNSNEVMGSDFMLVELLTSIPEDYHPYYAGWDLRETDFLSGVSIHHPAGSDKKISTTANPIVAGSYYFNNQQFHWKVNWSPTFNGFGITEGGSSGAGLLNNDGLIIGVLSGGSSTCDMATSPDYFGKINMAWQSEGANPNQQLKYWLNPTNTNITFLNGTYKPCLTINDTITLKSLTEVLIYPNPVQSLLFINLNHQKDIVERIAIYNTTGQIVKEIENPSGIIIIDMNFYTFGTYFVKLFTKNQVFTKKVVKIEK